MKRVRGWLLRHDARTVLLGSRHGNRGQHYSFYPATDQLVETFKDELAPYTGKINKGTIRFPLSQPVPVRLIARIAKFLAKEAAERRSL